jgi:hypothetical protein
MRILAPLLCLLSSSCVWVDGATLLYQKPAEAQAKQVQIKLGDIVIQEAKPPFDPPKIIAQCPIRSKDKTVNKWFNVRATRIGLIGKQTASGIIITKDLVFAALPSRKALYKWICVQYEDKSILCQVLDVGPWHITDDYWNNNNRPQSESEHNNKAGIDLSDAACKQLGISRRIGVVRVQWGFIDEPMP